MLRVFMHEVPRLGGVCTRIREYVYQFVRERDRQPTNAGRQPHRARELRPRSRVAVAERLAVEGRLVASVAHEENLRLHWLQPAHERTRRRREEIAQLGLSAVELVQLGSIEVHPALREDQCREAQRIDDLSRFPSGIAESEELE